MLKRKRKRVNMIVSFKMAKNYTLTSWDRTSLD